MQREISKRNQGVLCPADISISFFFFNFLLSNVWILLFAFLSAIDVGDCSVRLKLLYTAQISIFFSLTFNASTVRARARTDDV